MQARLRDCGVARTDYLKHAAGGHDADEAGQRDLRPRPADGVMRCSFFGGECGMAMIIASGPSSTSLQPPTAMRGEAGVGRTRK